VLPSPPCQQRRRAESGKHILADDPEYRQVCRDSARKWRADHPGYWKQYRAAKPEAVERNRTQPQRRVQRAAASPESPGEKYEWRQLVLPHSGPDGAAEHLQTVESTTRQWFVV
jgi:hypothetical protein